VRLVAIHECPYFGVVGGFATTLVLGLLLASNGGAQPTDPPLTLLATPPGASVRSLDAMGDALVFITSGDDGDRLWRAPLANVHMYEEVFADERLGRFGRVDERLLFLDHARRLWQTDGSPTGTTQISEVAVDGDAVACGGWIYFSSESGDVHRTDGSPGGSERIEYGGAPQQGHALGCVGETVVLVAEQAWPSDLLDALGAIQFVGVAAAGAFGPDVGYVRLSPTDAPDPDVTASLLRTDGTVAGTSTLLDAAPLGRGLALAGGRLFYSVETPLTYGLGADLFASGGEPGDAVQVGWLREIGIAAYSRPSLRLLASVGDLLFHLTGGFVWRSDGTAEGTFDLFGVRVTASPTNLGEAITSVLEADGRVYFGIVQAGGAASLLPATGRIMRTDGTPDGTQTLASWAEGTRGLAMAFAADELFVMGPPVPPCTVADDPLACELDGLRASLRCRADAPSALRRRQERKLQRLEQAIRGPHAVRAERAARRALILLARLERWFGKRRAIAKLHAECAGAMAQQVAAARERLAARGMTTHARLGDACADAMATRLDEARTRIAARNCGATDSSR
jgi:hypothetical protein